MLPRAHRIVRGDEYRRVVRRGCKGATAHVVVSVARSTGPTRFGCIVSKSVGNAVIRNRVRRRLQSVASLLLRDDPIGYDVVIRALPAAAEAGWPTLLEEVSRLFARGTEGGGVRALQHSVERP